MKDDKLTASGSQAVNLLLSELEETKRELAETRKANQALSEQLTAVLESRNENRTDLSVPDSILDRSPFLLARCDRDLRYRYVSQAYAKMVGLAPGEIVGKRIAEVIGDEAFRTIYPNIERVLRGERIESESRVPFKDAGERTLRVVYVPETNGNNEVTGWIASLIDITQERSAAQAMQESEKRFRSVFTGNMTAMGVWSAGGTVIEANDALLEMIGFSRTDLSEGNIDWLQLTAPEYRHLDRLALAELSRKQICEPYEKAFVTRDGLRVPVIFGASCFAGETDRGLFFVVDLTEPKRREANLAFLTDISEDLANLSNADEIVRTISAKVGRFLNVSSCLFAEISDRDDSAIVRYAWQAAKNQKDLSGLHTMSDLVTDEFRRMARNKEAVIVRNTETDPRTRFAKFKEYQIYSFVSVPFHRDREWRYLFVVDDDQPREWRRDEVQLIDEIANRVFPRLERAEAEAALMRSQAQLRAAAEFDAFRVALIDSLRTLERPDEIKAAATKILGRQLNVERVFYAEVDRNGDQIVLQPEQYVSGQLENLDGRIRMSDFSKSFVDEMRANRPLIIDDIHAFEDESSNGRAVFDRLRIRACIAYPLVKADKLIAILCASDRTPRQWTEPEFAHLKETAERTWAAVERTRTEKALKQNESQMRVITDAMPGLISYIDREYRYRFVNKAYTEWFGYPRDYFLGRTMTEIFGDQAFAELRRHIDRAFTGKFESFERKTSYRQGTRYIRASYTPDFADDGSVRGIFVLVVDITGRKLQEQALRQSEERYRGIVNQSISGIAEADLDGSFLTINKRYCDIVGYSPEELLSGMRMQDLVHPSERQEIEDKFADLIDRQIPFEIEKRYQRKDGSTVWVYNSVFLLRSVDGKPQSIAAVMIDITQRKAAEDELLERENMARLNAEISRNSLLSAEPLPAILRSCTDSLVEYLGAAFVRIWLADETGTMLELKASSGMYTHLDGRHARIPVGQLKIGTIAAERRPHHTNDVSADPKINDQEWAASQKITAFAGFPLVADEKLIGVVALFSQRPLTEQKFAALGQAANLISSAIARIRAEDALRESEERFRKMADHAPVMIWVTEADGSCSYLSKSWFEYTGQTPATGLGFGYIDAIHPDERDADKVHFENAAVTLKPFTFEHRLRHRSGEYRWVICSAQPRFGESGELLGFIGSVLDITERKEVESKLLAKDELLTQITNVTPTLLTRCSREQRYLFVNRAAAEFLGLPPEKIVGQPIRRIMGNAAYKQILPYIRRVLAGENVEYETEVDYAAAGRRFMQVTYVPEIDREHRVIGWFATMTDFTERKKNEETRAFLASIIESSDDAVLSKDLNGNITSWNKAAEKTFGYKEDEIIGKPVTVLIPAFLGNEESKIIERLRNGDSIEHYETIRRRKDGSLVNVSLTVSPIRDYAGRIVGASKIARDITERKQAELSLRQSEARLKLAMEISALGTWDLDYQNDLMIWSDKLFEIFGMEPTPDGQMTLAEWETMVHPDDRERVIALSREASANHRLFNTEFRVVRRDTGETRWLSALAQFFYADNDRPSRSVGIIRDITTRREAQDKLRQSEEFNSIIATISTDWAFSAEVDRDGRVIPDAITNGFTKHLGYRFDKIADSGIWNRLIHPDDRHFALKELRKLLKGDMVSGEIRLVTADGQTVVSQYQTRPIMGPTGRIVRIYGAIRDITLQKLSEQSLRESEERLQDVISSATEYAIFTLTLDGVINSWSVGAEHIFGYSAKEIIGQSFEILFTPANRRKRVPDLEMRNALIQGRASDDRYQLRKNGTRFFASGVMMPLLKNGKASGFVKITRDMTSQITAEKAVRDKEILKKLVAAQEDERRRIARDLHDELGQQLTALRLKLETTRRICSDEAIEAELSVIQSIAKQIDNGVDFLAWELRPVALDDLGLFAALDKYVTEWSGYSGIAAELLPSTLKGQRFSSEVETNLYRIAQEALNNASKHSLAHKVEIQLEKRNNMIVLIISDNGVGFDSKMRTINNSGIGLIGMQERALLIGGQVEIESSIGGGSTIYVRVPAAFNRKERVDER